MRALGRPLLLYALFLLQLNLTRWGPDLLLLAVVVIALHEGRLAATAYGLFAGLLVDLTAPAFAGAGLVALGGVALFAATLRDLFYRGKWSVTLVALVGLALKWALAALAGSLSLEPLPLVVAAGLTLAASPVAAAALGRLLYPAWKNG
jgi:cell shape-determining protein MreD